MEDKSPPQNIEAERAVLGAILLDPKTIHDVALKNTDFYKEAHEIIFWAMSKIKEKGIELIALTEFLEIEGKLERVGGVSYISQLAVDIPTSANIKRHAEIVKDKSARRTVLAASKKIIQNIEDVPLDELGKIMRQAFEVDPSSQMLGTKHIREVVPEVLELIERRYKSKAEISGITSGFRELDFFTDGFQSELYIVGGRSSHGKSALVKDILVNAAKAGHQGHLINIEDGNQNMGRRLFAREADLALWKIKKGQLTDEELQKIVHTAGILAELPITFDDTIRGIEPILNSTRRAVEGGAEFVIIDFLQLIKGDKTKTRTTEIGEIIQEIKDLCKPAHLDVPVIVTCQLLKEVDKRTSKKPTLADLRESGDIEIHADVVLLLYRPGAYKPTATIENDIELMIVKGKNIGTGSVPLTFIPDKTTFRDRDQGVLL